MPATLNVRFRNADAGSCRAAYVKNFGRRQAYESRRGRNPRCPRHGLWGFVDLLMAARLEASAGGTPGGALQRGGAVRVRLELAGFELSDRACGIDRRCRREFDGRPECQGCGGEQEHGVPGHAATVPVGLADRGGPRGGIHRSKVSMMRMRPPQQGQGGSGSGGAIGSAGRAGGASARISRARARLALRDEAASWP